MPKHWWYQDWIEAVEAFQISVQTVNRKSITRNNQNVLAFWREGNLKLLTYPLKTQPLRKAVKMMLRLKQFDAREEFFAITRVHLNIYCTFLLRRSYTRKIVRKFSQSAKSTTPKMKISRHFIWTFLKVSCIPSFKVWSYFDISA